MPSFEQPVPRQDVTMESAFMQTLFAMGKSTAKICLMSLVAAHDVSIIYIHANGLHTLILDTIFLS